MTVDVYAQYFSAECMYSGVRRRAVLVSLTADSEAGRISYTASATFFPHTTDDGYAVSYDAVVSKVLYDNTGRRSKKREQELLTGFRAVIEELAAPLKAVIYWDKPLRDARRG